MKLSRLFSSLSLLLVAAAVVWMVGQSLWDGASASYVYATGTSERGVVVDKAPLLVDASPWIAVDVLPARTNYRIPIGGEALRDIRVGDSVEVLRRPSGTGGAVLPGLDIRRRKGYGTAAFLSASVLLLLGARRWFVSRNEAILDDYESDLTQI